MPPGVEAPTVLVLDEPTNHLDLEGIQALAQGLLSYEGTLIFVSHDRWFVDKVATRIIEITPEGVEDFPGTYQEHLAKNAADDHLSAEQVAERAREEKREKKRERKRQKKRERERSSKG